jgi:NADH dehydrogenase FAD-containing subunit
MLQALIHPTDVCAKLQIPLRDCVPAGIKLVQGYLNAIEASDEAPGGLVLLRGAPVTQLPYDYLVLATGSVYPPPCKAHPDTHALYPRQHSLIVAHEQLKRAQRIVIVGGGPVGVELAAEIRCKWHDKQVTIVQGGPTLLTGIHCSFGQAASEWMHSHRVSVVLNEKVAAHSEIYDAHDEDADTNAGNNNGGSAFKTHTLTTNKGTVLEADTVFYCVGTHPQSDFLERSSDFLRKFRRPDGRIVVDEHLLVGGLAQQGVFAVGDVVAHPFLAEPLLAYTAEKHANAVARSIIALSENDELCRYPLDLTGLKTSPDIICVSLGPSAAILGFNSLHLTDSMVGQRIGALLKAVIETTKVWQLRNGLVGRAFWSFGDSVSLAIHRFFPEKS